LSKNFDENDEINSETARKKLANLGDTNNGIKNNILKENKNKSNNNENDESKKLKNNKKLTSIFTYAEYEFNNLSQFINHNVDNIDPNKLRIYSINKIASIKSRQNVKLRNCNKGKHKNKNKNKKEIEKESESVVTTNRDDVNDFNSTNNRLNKFANMTDNKSRLTVSNKKAKSSENIKLDKSKQDLNQSIEK